MNAFRYHPDILERYPNLRAGVILARGMSNGPTPQALKEAYLAEQRATLERIGATPLSEIESLSAWRGAFRLFGVNPTKYRSAPEALLRRLTKKGDIPNINTLVDLTNLVSIRYALPIATFDLRELSGGITVRFAEGMERFTPLGADQVEHPEPGEVIFVDEAGRVVARRWCWRQSEESAAQAETKEAIITIETQHANGPADVQAALEDMLTLLEGYAGGNFKSSLLNPDNPGISF